MNDVLNTGSRPPLIFILSAAGKMWMMVAIRN